MAFEKETDEEVKKNQLMGLLHLQSTPRKVEVTTWGYDLGTASGRRDNCATVLLALLLLVTAVTVSGFTSAIQLIYVQPDLCKSRESTLSTNIEVMRNITNYFDARATTSLAVNITATAYYDAEEYYNALDLRFQWPAPYDLSEEERQELELQAREGGNDCKQVKECVGGVTGFVGGFFGQRTCAEVDVPCPDIEATGLLVEYDSSQKSLDLFGHNASEADRQAYNTTVAQTALDRATDAISVLVRRLCSNEGCVTGHLFRRRWKHVLRTCGRAKWNQRIFDILANVNKPIWITFIVLIWYAHELFQSVINSSLYNVIWSNFLEDPCWADPDFLLNTSLSIRETCTDITSARNLFNQASANYRYYDQVEATWRPLASARAGPFYGDPEEDFPQNFPGNCSGMVLLDAIQPGDGSVNWWSLFFYSGAFVALLLQLVLAHWFVSWFSVLRPLTMHRGRIMVPESSRGDHVLFREVRSFARRRAILPFAFTSVFLLFLLINLGVASSDGGMRRKVLIVGFLLAFLQFVAVPLLIWRPADEIIMPKPKFESSHRLHGPADDGTTAAAAQGRHGRPSVQPKWEDEDGEGAWDSGSGLSVLSSSPSPGGKHPQRAGVNGIPDRSHDQSNGHQHEEQTIERTSSSESLSSVLQAALAASAKAAAVGEAREPARFH